MCHAVHIINVRLSAAVDCPVCLSSLIADATVCLELFALTDRVASETESPLW